MRCRLTPRRRTSWYFQARSPKCRWPYLSPRRWWGRTLLLRRTSRQEEKRLRKVREAKAFSTRRPNVGYVCNTLIYRDPAPLPFHPIAAWIFRLKNYTRIHVGLLTKPTVEISPFFCLFSAPEIRIKSRIHLSHAFHFPIFCFLFLQL